MSRQRIVQFTIALLAVAFIAAPSVTAQPFNRTFVSAQAGNDSNSCVSTAPCRSFPRALLQTAANGEVIVLDSGGYGAFTVTQSVQIHAPLGVYAGITATAGSAITINNASLVVRLKGLSINGAGGSTGIQASAVGTLYVENTSITGFSVDGLRFPAGGALFLSDSLIRRNVNSGLNLNSDGGTITAAIDRVSLQENGFGVYAGSNTQVVVHDTFGGSNTNSAFHAQSSGKLTLESVIASHNGFGVSTYAGGSILVSNCTITHNGVGLQEISASVATRLNNTIEFNGTPTVGTITSYTAK